MFLIFILGFTVVPIALWLGFSFDLPASASVAIGAVLIAGISAVLLRPAKALVVALQYHGRHSGRGEGQHYGAPKPKLCEWQGIDLRA